MDKPMRDYPTFYPDDGLTQEEHAALAEQRVCAVLAETRKAKLDRLVEVARK